jgi:hypothetical protein
VYLTKKHKKYQYKYLKEKITAKYQFYYRFNFKKDLFLRLDFYSDWLDTINNKYKYN